ncbi:MAG: LysM domain-containing protein, partial [Deltaproteobacteria bacterium]
MDRQNSLRLKTQDSRLKALIWGLESIVCLILIGCSISHGVYHKVEKGQTLWRIAKAYNVDIQEVGEWNDIADPEQIMTGEKIFIPGAWRLLKVEPYKPPEE